MFSKSSRYNGLKLLDREINKKFHIKVVSLRRISLIEGDSITIKGNDRLDIISSSKYKNSTLFWHIADANTELQANNLTKSIGPYIKKIKVPKQ